MNDAAGSPAVETPVPPELVVLSRQLVASYRSSRPYAVISIHPPEMSAVRLYPDPLRLERINVVFHDVESQVDKYATVFDARMAERTANFVVRHAQHRIVINCIAGISRSAGLATGIRLAYGVDPRPFSEPPYEPNALVRDLIAAALSSKLGRL